MISFWGFPKWRSPQITRAMFSMILNVLYSGNKQGNAYAIAYVFLTRIHVLLTRTCCLTRSLRCLTLTTVLLMPHPYKGPLPKHEFKGFECGSSKLRSFSIEMYGDFGIPLQSRNHSIQHSWFLKPMFVIGWTNLFTTVLVSVVGLTPHFCTFWLIAYPSGWII